MINEIVNILSLIVSLMALIATVIIAIHTNTITKKQGEESTTLSQLNNEITEKIRESVEYLSPAQIKFTISSIKHPLRSAGYIDRNTDHYIYGTTLKIQGSLEKTHGQIIKNYVFYKKCDGTTLKQSFKNSIEIDLFNINKDDDLNYIHSHFFVVYVDSALKIHRILVEIIATATSKSHGNTNTSTIHVPNGKETRQELEQKSGSILYRIWNEFDLVENSYEQINNNDWRNGYNNEKESLNKKQINDLEKQEFNSSQIMEEIKEINKTFSNLGFN